MKTYLTVIAAVLLSVTNYGFAAATPPAAAAGSGQILTDPATGMEFVLVKGGCYTMGSAIRQGSDETPEHEVCVADFYLGKYEVTQGEWEKVMKKNPSGFNTCGVDCPVESVSWDDSQEFIKKLNALTNKKYRLPTEAEWEYAARSGGRDEAYAGTSDEKLLGEYAWFEDNAGKAIHPVGQKKPNGLGLYDMTGNVDEWTQDWYASDYYKVSPKSNPAGPATGEERASRGGSWDFDSWRARDAHRRKFEPSYREDGLGLRLLLPVK